VFAFDQGDQIGRNLASMFWVIVLLWTVLLKIAEVAQIWGYFFVGIFLLFYMKKMS
jgi:hypothetical protein